MSYTYDNSGNITNDSFNTYTWDQFGKMLAANSTSIVYDALGRAVEIASGSSGTEIWCTQLGKTAYMYGGTINYAYWPTPGGGTLLETSNSGSDYYLHKDWLGNARISTSVASHALVADNSFSPYGETYNVLDSTNQNQQMFTGLTQDVLSGMWDTPNRELAPQGRWLSPDPAGQGWNQYAYATNPNSLVDPTGLGVTGMGGFHQYPVGNPWYTVDIFEWMGIATGTVGADGSGSCAPCQNMVPNLFNGQMQPIYSGGTADASGLNPDDSPGCACGSVADGFLLPEKELAKGLGYLFDRYDVDPNIPAIALASMGNPFGAADAELVMGSGMQALAGFNIAGSWGMVDDTYTMNIALMSNPTKVGQFGALSDALVAQAQAAGANQISVTGSMVSNPQFADPEFMGALASRYGWTYQQIDSSTFNLTRSVP